MKIVLSTNGAGKTEEPHEKTTTIKKSINLDTDLIVSTKINSKWIININVKRKTIKLIEYNIRENPDYCGYSKDILDMTPKAQTLKEIIDVYFIKIKNFCSAKENAK